MKSSSRNLTLDAMKGIAIIAVVLYHLGVMPNGYLGVDVFLVINGYFITKGILSAYSKGGLNYFQFLCKRIVRLWPLVVLAGLVALLIGYFVMLPDDLENLAQSVVASNFFMNNILACITTGNYWDLVNAHKPLMHFWYMGIVVQCYLVYPLIFMVVHKCCRNGNFIRVCHIVFWALLGLSVLLYVLPGFSTAQKFYYLPFRFFEMALGGVVALGCLGDEVKLTLWLKRSVYVGITGLMLTVNEWIGVFNVLIISILSGGGIAAALLPKSNISAENRALRLMASIGKASFSIFVWHQVVFAFYKYSIANTFGVVDYVLALLFTIVVSWSSYRWIETPIDKYSRRQTMRVLGITAIIAVVTTLLGLALYVRAGVVRDIPELDVYTDNIHRGMHAEYCDRVYKMETDFADNGRKKIMVIGDSYARDFVNVLLESAYKDSFDIRYMFPHQENLTEVEKDRLIKADMVFVRASYCEGNMQILSEITELCDSKPVYGISTKEYGGTNGNVYRHRSQKGYFQSKVSMSEKYREDYKAEKRYWGKMYVDFVAPVSDKNGLLQVFTDDHKYISQDCRHLTRSGAKYYARVLPLEELFSDSNFGSW